MTHPLTDEKAMSLFSFERLMDASQPITVEDSMRTAADWQLEQAIEWLKINTEDYVCEEYYGAHFLTENFLDNFKKAMRLTTTQEDNQ